MAIICTRMAIFGTFWPFLLLEPFGLYLSVLHVEQMCLFHPFEKMVKILLPKSHQKLKKWPFLSVKLAILGYFSRFSPDSHLNICSCDRQDFTEATLVPYLPRYLDFKAQQAEKPSENGLNLHLNGHFWQFLAIFVAERA